MSAPPPYTYQDGSTFVGYFRAGLRDGAGTLTLRNGDTFVGTWHEGLLTCAEGTFVSKSTGRYKGGFHNGLRDTQHTGAPATWHDSNGMLVYKGGWRHDKFHGKGTLEQPGWRYTGDWVDGFMRGQGVFTIDGVITVYGGGKWRYADGKVSEAPASAAAPFAACAWDSAGMATGPALLLYPDGSAYVGPLVKGLQHGQGVVYAPDGTRDELTFERGELVQSDPAVTLVANIAADAAIPACVRDPSLQPAPAPAVAAMAAAPVNPRPPVAECWVITQQPTAADSHFTPIGDAAEPPSMPAPVLPPTPPPAEADAENHEKTTTTTATEEEVAPTTMLALTESEFGFADAEGLWYS